jgi:hypothetical protein
MSCARPYALRVTTDDSEELFPPELTLEALGLISGAVRRAYTECIARFDPGVGFTNQTFGQMVFRSAWYFLEKALGGREDVRIAHPDGGFEVHLGPISLAPYKVPLEGGGAVPGLPRNEARLAGIAASGSQARLFEGLRQTKFVLAHVGDPLLGLRAIYVGAPIRGSSEENYEWAWLRRIDTAAPATPLPEPVEIPEPVVTPLRRGERTGRAPAGGRA